MSRVFEERIAISYEKIAGFFEERGRRLADLGNVVATIYQDKNPELARKRDENEKRVILPKLELEETHRVLDIGCGTGRWAVAIAPRVGHYVGADMNEEFLNAARSWTAAYEITNAVFRRLSALDLNADIFREESPFDRFVISGLLIYINDEDIRNLLCELSRMASADSIIYIREPYAIENRLTIKDHYSSDLETEYSAIYRTIPEYLSLFEPLFRYGFELTDTSDLFAPALQNHRDTSQAYFILKRNHQSPRS